ncbi:ABC transporter permease [Paenibacillus sp. FSL H7-0357]|uniref:ABC transporter permease n=1 Tax=Paenibacillus sp. FSL H7-0357 TaxID=1536774 RepID=UPI001E3412CA|nr:ABC transporter permease [Paenibacillus sp. FSL H7-0357]
MTKLIRHECKDLLRNPSIIILVMLPIFMSKIIISVMDKNGINFMLLSTWILFAQVMVGIMMTGPGLIEERESKTFDALLISPLGRGQILVAKGLTVLLFSVLSQTVVFLLNQGFASELLSVFPYMLAGGILFVEVGMIIGLKLDSSKNGSAVSSAVMVVFFLLASVYQALPDWTYPFFAALPSIEIVENLNRILNGDGPLLFESLLLPLWMTVLALWIWRTGKE